MIRYVPIHIYIFINILNNTSVISVFAQWRARVMDGTKDKSSHDSLILKFCTYICNYIIVIIFN